MGGVKPETRFRQGKVVPFLNTLPRCFWDGIAQKGKTGSPDIYLCLDGTFIALELKARGGKLTKIQEHVMDKIRRAKGIAIEVNPDNWASVKEWLTKRSKGEKCEYQSSIYLV